MADIEREIRIQQLPGTVAKASVQIIEDQVIVNFNLGIEATGHVSGIHYGMGLGPQQYLIKTFNDGNEEDFLINCGRAVGWVSGALMLIDSAMTALVQYPELFPDINKIVTEHQKERALELIKMVEEYRKERQDQKKST